MKKLHFAVFTVVLAVYAMSFQGMRGLGETTEGRYANVALEMIRLDDWVHPKLHHERPHWTKPPMTYWAIAASVKLFGGTTFASRLPNALAFMLTTLLVFSLGRIFVPSRPWAPALIYATFGFPVSVSNFVNTDTLLTLFETAAMTGFVHAFWYRGNHFAGRHGALLGWIALGGAFLTKGPPALLPLAALLVFLILSRKQAETTRFRLGWGWIWFIVIGSSWFLYVIFETPHLLGYFLRDEFVKRIATGYHHRNSQWYGALVVYVPVLLLGTLPWSLFVWRGMVRGIGDAWRRWRGKQPIADHQGLLLLLWVLLPLALFFAAKSRLPAYILPLFVPMSLLGARMLPEDSWWTKKKWLLIGAWCVLLVILRPISSVVPIGRNSEVLADQIRRLTAMDIREVAFVDTRPYYGLSLYLDAEIEMVLLEQNTTPVAGEESLEEELRAYEPGRLWVVAKRDADRFRKRVGREGAVITSLGLIKGAKQYEVFIDLPAKE